MFVYWGGIDSGKGHIRSFASLNSKTQVLWLPLLIKKIKTETHIDGGDWRDETFHEIIYHNVRNEFRECKSPPLAWKRPRKFVHPHSSIKPDPRPWGDKKRKKEVKSREYSEEDIVKYTQKEYMGTLVYYDIIRRHNGRGAKGISVPLTSELLKDHYHKIFEGVDIMSYIIPSWAMRDLAELLRKSVNVIPFKSDHLDSCVSKLDGFSNFRFLSVDNSEYGNDLLEVYNQDKNRVWKWLDSFREDDEKVKRRLKSYDIPYVMFDLDQDSYTDFFGWEREMDRKYSHRGKTWEGERYEKVVEIAKEYIHLHSF